jgi:hypothetical protein
VIDGPDFRIQKKHAFASAYNPQLFGTVTGSPGGSTVEYRFGLRPFPGIGMTLVLIFLAAGTILFVVFGLMSGDFTAVPIPPIVAGVLIAMQRIEWGLRFREDKEVLLKHLTDSLGRTEAELPVVISESRSPIDHSPRV